LKELIEMKFIISKEKIKKRFNNIHTESIYGFEVLENIEKGNYPSFLGTKATEILKWIHFDFASKTDTELYAHRSVNDLIYTLQYFYGVTFVEDENSLMTEELTMEEFRLLVEYSEFIFKKHYFGLTREEYEEIYRKELLEKEILKLEQMELGQQEVTFTD
jgi:hypothetical protein